MDSCPFHVLLLLVGTALAVPATSPWSVRNADTRSTKTHYPTTQPLNGLCPDKLTNSFKLALVYTAMDREVHVTRQTLHPLLVKADMVERVGDLLSTIRRLKVRHLLDTSLARFVPVTLWVMEELDPVLLDGQPELLPNILGKIHTLDCSVLPSSADLMYILNSLRTTESTFKSELNDIIRVLPASHGLKTLLVSRLSDVAETMAWTRNLILRDVKTPTQLITYWTETEHPMAFKLSLKIYLHHSQNTLKRTSLESLTDGIPTHSYDYTEMNVRLPVPTHVTCYQHKLAVYKLLLVKYAVGFHGEYVETTLARSLNRPDLVAKIPRQQLDLIHQTLPITLAKMLNNVHQHLNYALTSPIVGSVLSVLEPNLDVKLLTTLSAEPHNLEHKLQTLVDRLMESDDLCLLDLTALNTNLTHIITHLRTLTTPSAISEVLKPILLRYMVPDTVNKVVRVFESEYTPVYELHCALLSSIMSDMTTRPRPETLLARIPLMYAATPTSPHLSVTNPNTDELITSLRRMGVKEETPLMLVPAPLLREVLLNMAAHLAPTSVPCARLVAAKLAAGFGRTLFKKQLDNEEDFIRLYIRRSLGSDITLDEAKRVATGIRKIFSDKIERTFTDDVIVETERVLFDLVRLEKADFKKPVSVVLRPVLDRIKQMVNGMTGPACGQNVHDIRQKTIAAMINILQMGIVEREVETVVRTAVNSEAVKPRLVQLLSELLPEVTGALLEQLQLLNDYTDDVRVPHIGLIFADSIVRLLSEVCPVPMIHEMYARFPTEPSLAIVTQPRAQRFTSRLLTLLAETLTMRNMKVTTDEFNLVTKSVMSKLNSLEYTEDSIRKLPKMLYDVASTTLSTLGDLPLVEATPTQIRHVISLGLRELERAHLEPECLDEARITLTSGVVRVLLERRLMTSSPSSDLFIRTYTLVHPHVHSLTEIQSITKVLASALQLKIKDAMSGLDIFKDTAADQVGASLLRLPYERFSGLTLRELLSEPLNALKTFYTRFSTCTRRYDTKLYHTEADKLLHRLGSLELAESEITQLLTPVVRDSAMLNTASRLVSEVLVPEIRHEVATLLMYSRNALTAPSPAVFRSFLASHILHTFGLTSPAPLRGFVEHPLYDLFTAEMYEELLRKLTEQGRLEPLTASNLLQKVFIHTLQEPLINPPVNARLY